MALGLQKKWPALKAAGHRIVVIDQDTEVIKTKQTRSWFSVNSRPRLPVSGVRASLNLLGAVTGDGEQFIIPVDGSFTGTVACHFLRALQHEVGRKLVIVLDNAPYFIARKVKKQAAKDGLFLEYLPPYAPELNSLEQCWPQPKAGRANRMFRMVDKIQSYVKAALPTITPPQIYEYLC